MERILVLGSSGMAGHVIYRQLKEKKEFLLYNFSHQNRINDETILFDIMNISNLERNLNKLNLDVIINCVGILNNYAEENPEKAIFLNSYFPKYLEKKYKNTNTRIIHLSTDCVFSGFSGPYVENSPKDGEGIYSRTKALGEIDNHKDLTIRTSIIGPDMLSDGIGLFNWFMKQKGKIFGFTNAFWTGVTTIELSKFIYSFIKKPNISGVIHLVPNKSISKFHLLKLCQEVFQITDLDILEKNDVKINKSLISTRRDFQYIVPEYKVMLNEMRCWIKHNKDIYSYEIK